MRARGERERENEIPLENCEAVNIMLVFCQQQGIGNKHVQLLLFTYSLTAAVLG